MNPLEEIKSTTNGLALLVDWLGPGCETTSRDKAQSRAFVCEYGADGSGCPSNVEPGWWDRVKDGVAGIIRRQIEIKNKLNLELSNESRIHMCRNCGCALQLKVWCPTSTIRNHTSEETMNKFPSFCWILKELKP